MVLVAPPATAAHGTQLSANTVAGCAEQLGIVRIKRRPRRMYLQTGRHGDLAGSPEIIVDRIVYIADDGTFGLLIEPTENHGLKVRDAVRFQP